MQRLCALFLTLAVVASAAAESWSFETYEDPAGTVTRLSSQTEVPFVFLGKPVEPEHPKYEQYKEAIARFPDVRSCLVAEERDASQPDLTAFNWQAMGTPFDAEVCIYRIATSYRDAKSYENWLAKQEFDPIGRIEYPASGSRERFRVYGYWSVEGKGMLLGLDEGLYTWYAQVRPYRLHVSVRYQLGYGVDSVSVSYKIN